MSNIGSPHQRARKAADYIVAQVEKVRPWASPRIGLVLGSGLGALGDEVEDAVRIPYAEIPGFPVSSVVGHAGKMVLGTLQGVPVILMQGRVHFYEGYTIEEVVRPLRTLGLLGIKGVILTNAAGGVHAETEPGTLMIITDHLNLAGANPLVGPNDPDLGVRFPDMTRVYDPEFIASLRKSGEKVGATLEEGVYAWLKGPSYETPAEVRMVKGLGADAVGMSTVPEAVAARHMNIRVGGVSCITNKGAGIGDQLLNHKEVEETANRVRGQFCAMIKEALPQIDGLLK